MGDFYFDMSPKAGSRYICGNFVKFVLNKLPDEVVFNIYKKRPKSKNYFKVHVGKGTAYIFNRGKLFDFEVDALQSDFLKNNSFGNNFYIKVAS